MESQTIGERIISDDVSNKLIINPTLSGVFCLYGKVSYICSVKRFNEGRIIGFNCGVF